jgi:hypothetical protein
VLFVRVASCGFVVRVLSLRMKKPWVAGRHGDSGEEKREDDA